MTKLGRFLHNYRKRVPQELTIYNKNILVKQFQLYHCSSTPPSHTISSLQQKDGKFKWSIDYDEMTIDHAQLLLLFHKWTFSKYHNGSNIIIPMSPSHDVFSNFRVLCHGLASQEGFSIKWQQVFRNRLNSFFK